MVNYQTWLETPNVVRVIIAQVQAIISGSLTTRYIATHGVTVDSTPYTPIISNNIEIDESISVDYAASISYGDIEIANHNGEYDTWLNDIWANKSIKLYVGPYISGNSTITDYQQIFDGIIVDIDSKSRTKLNIKIRDKLEKLNTSISEVLLGNYYHGNVLADNSVAYQNQYKTTLKPLVFGEVHNITPLLTDPTMLEYMVCLEAVEQILEVRDNGIPVLFTTVGSTTTIPPGSFQLLASPVGTVTCSVQGVKRTINIGAGTISATFNASVSNTIATILKVFGNTVAYTEIDTSSFGSLGTAPVGIYINNRVNVLQQCQDMAKSSGLILSTTRLGVLKLIDLKIPTSATVTITDSDIILNSLSISQRLDISAGIRLGYARNWTVQTGLVTAIPQQHKDLYAEEWLESVQIDATTKTNYGITVEPTLETTYLIDKVSADTLALNKLNLFKARRKIMSMTCTAKQLSIQVGDAVTLNSSRFNLAGGVLGLVISTKPNWIRGTIDIGILL